VGDAPDWGNEVLDDTAAALIQKDRLQHKSEDVRLLVACALSDIIRIYAPEAPYDDEALKVRPRDLSILFIYFFISGY
jgi:hypothetical protein